MSSHLLMLSLASFVCSSSALPLYVKVSFYMDNTVCSGFTGYVNTMPTNGACTRDGVSGSKYRFTATKGNTSDAVSVALFNCPSADCTCSPYEYFTDIPVQGCKATGNSPGNSFQSVGVVVASAPGTFLSLQECNAQNVLWDMPSGNPGPLTSGGLCLTVNATQQLAMGECVSPPPASQIFRADQTSPYMITALADTRCLTVEGSPGGPEVNSTVQLGKQCRTPNPSNIFGYLYGMLGLVVNGSPVTPGGSGLCLAW